MKTDELEGHRLTVVLPAAGYDSLSVKISGPVDRLSAALAKAGGEPVQVEFSEFKARLFVIDGRPVISAKASSVQIAAPDTKGGDENELIL